MAEPTITEVFGNNASQTATELVVSKADFAALGLPQVADNTAESLLMAIILKAQSELTPDNRAADNTNRQVTVEPTTPDIFDDGATTYERKSYYVTVYSPYTETPPDLSVL